MVVAVVAVEVLQQVKAFNIKPSVGELIGHDSFTKYIFRILLYIAHLAH